MPDLVAAPIWKYYPYFADHKGTYICLAYADDLKGPWVVHPPGSLQLADWFFLTEPPDAPQEAVEESKKQRLASSGLETMQRDILTELATPHIASPDVHVDTVDETIVMHFHGLDGLGRQVTRVATSPNGIHFTAEPDSFSRSYLRAFTNDSHTYALVMPG